MSAIIANIYILQLQSQIQETINICNFINLIEEQIQEDSDSILDEIVAWHSSEIKAKSDKDIKEQVLIIKETNALFAI